jgi:hypothetical protein
MHLGVHAPENLTEAIIAEDIPIFRASKEKSYHFWWVINRYTTIYRVMGRHTIFSSTSIPGDF